jgi:hypothetical protein
MAIPACVWGEGLIKLLRQAWHFLKTTATELPEKTAFIRESPQYGFLKFFW